MHWQKTKGLSSCVKSQKNKKNCWAFITRKFSTFSSSSANNNVACFLNGVALVTRLCFQTPFTPGLLTCPSCYSSQLRQDNGLKCTNPLPPILSPGVRQRVKACTEPRQCSMFPQGGNFHCQLHIKHAL